MKSHIIVDNIKCGGCAATVTKKVSNIKSVSAVEVDVETGKVSFDAENEESIEQVISTLKKWGYPLQNSGTKLDNAKSYVSCMIGRVDNAL